MNPDNDELEDKVSGLNSRTEFVQFLVSLQQDLENHPKEWENLDLNSYLGALGAFLNDADGYYKNMKIEVSADTPSWRLFADCMLAARVYE